MSAVVLTGLLLSAAAIASHNDVPVQFERFGAYVVVDSVDRTAAFYERVLGKSPQLRSQAMVGFDLAGGLFALVSKEKYAPNVVRGDNAVPYIKVANVERLFSHIESVAPTSLQTTQVQVEGPFRFFKIRDPDGNIIEFFSVGPAGK